MPVETARKPDMRAAQAPVHVESTTAKQGVPKNKIGSEPVATVFDLKLKSLPFKVSAPENAGFTRDKTNICCHESLAGTC